MCTLWEMVRHGTSILQKAKIDTARLDGEVLLAFLLGITRSDVLTSPDRRVTSSECEAFKALLQRRCNREPIGYITEEKEFMSLSFYVNPHVLIPRPETEHLVSAVVKRVQPGYRAWDLGTGSGCIAISLAKYSQPGFIFASDIDSEALTVAKKNAVRHQVEIKFEKGDLFEPAQALKNPQSQFDVLVMNPPYIGWEEGELLAPELDFEPKKALFAREKGGEFYRRIARNAGPYLKEGGILVLELSGSTKMGEWLSYFEQGPYASREILRDYSGIQRVLIATKKKEN